MRKLLDQILGLHCYFIFILIILLSNIIVFVYAQTASPSSFTLANRVSSNVFSSTHSTVPLTSTPSYTVTNASIALSNKVLFGSPLNHIIITKFSQSQVAPQVKIIDAEKNKK
jgi:hypothetical protein